MIQKLRYRLFYWWRKVALFVGICPVCRTELNYTLKGRPVCPRCGR